MTYLTLEEQQRLDELKLKHLIGGAAIAASALLSHDANEPKYISKQEQSSENTRHSLSDLSKRVDDLTQKVLSKYKVEKALASKIVKLAIKHEASTFPKAEDILSIVGIESSFKPGVQSQLKKDPAIGLMQVRPGIWDISPTSLKTNIDHQIESGANILKLYYKKLHSKEAAVHSYNIGITNFLKKKGLNPAYVEKFERDREIY